MVYQCKKSNFPKKWEKYQQDEKHNLCSQELALYIQIKVIVDRLRIRNEFKIDEVIDILKMQIYSSKLPDPRICADYVRFSKFYGEIEYMAKRTA